MNMRKRIRLLETKHESLSYRHEDLSDCHAKLQKEHNLCSDYIKLQKEFMRQSKILYCLALFVLIVAAFILGNPLDVHIKR